MLKELTASQRQWVDDTLEPLTLDAFINAYSPHPESQKMQSGQSSVKLNSPAIAPSMSPGMFIQETNSL